MLLDVEVRLCQNISPKKINFRLKWCAKFSAHDFYLMCRVYARGAHSTNLLNGLGQTCAQFAFCALPNSEYYQLNLVREQKTAQYANSRSVCMPAQVDNSEKLRAIWSCALLYILFSLSGPKREKLVALRESMRLAWSAVATSMEGKSNDLHVACVRFVFVFFYNEKWISINKYLKKRLLTHPPTNSKRNWNFKTLWIIMNGPLPI